MGVDRYDLEELHRDAEARVAAWRASLRPATTEPKTHPDSAAEPETPVGHAPAHPGATPSPHAAFLGGVTRDENGLQFTRELLDAVVGAGDPFAAAFGLRDASKHLPDSLPMRDRVALRAGGLASLGLPWAVLPVARRWLRERVSALVLSQSFPNEAADQAPTAALAHAMQHHTEQGTLTALSLTGGAVLGEQAVAREVQRLCWLARQANVTHLMVDPERVAVSASPWGDESAADRAATALRPLMEAALQHNVLVTLQPRSYRGALLATEILVRVCADTALAQVRPGIWVPAELADSGSITDRLIRWSRARVREGGHPLTITVGVAGCAGHERISSLLTGLPVPTLENARAYTAQTIRLFDLLLGAVAKGDVRATLASEDPGVLAVAAELIARSRVPEGTAAVQVRAGTADEVLRAWRATDDHTAVDHPEAADIDAPADADVLADDERTHPPMPPVWQVLTVTPVDEYAGLLNALIDLSAEACDPESAIALAAAFSSDGDGEAGTEADDAPRSGALWAALELAAQPFPLPHRTQNRAREWDPSARDSALFYRPPADEHGFDTSGLTAAVLGLSRGVTGQIVREPVGRTLPIPVISATGFANEPLTDALSSENREWVRRLLQQAVQLRASWAQARANDADAAARTVSAAELGPLADTKITEALVAAAPWRELRAVDRSTRVRRLALGAAAARDRFFTVLAAETGSPVGVLDAEMNGAIDAARYLGQQAANLGAVRGAEFVADALTVVVCEPGVPFDERAEAMVASLAAGSAVICVAHQSVWHSTEALIEEWRAAGLPTEIVTLVEPARTTAELRAVAAAFTTDPRVDRASVLGTRDTAAHLVRSRPALRVNGQFRALGSVAITPSAGGDDAVRGVVRSAFGAGHAAATRAHALVLLGNVARSRAMLTQLEDAVRALCPGDTGAVVAARSMGAQPRGASRAETVVPGRCDDPLAFDVGPLAEPPTAAGLRALTVLHPGEKWLVQPQALDHEWRLWSPGVRTGVAVDSPFWADAVGMPVIGVTTARTVSELITVQSRLGGETVAGLFATEPSEVLPWLNGMQAARLTVGHATTPAVVERQPSGGWGAASMGSGQLAGGPNRLVTLGSWKLREGTQSPTLHLRGLSPEVRLLIERTQPDLEYRTFDRVRRAALSDALAWRTDLGRLTDTLGIGARQHLIRRHPVATHVRHAEGAPLGDLVRVLSAALLVNAPITVSSGSVLPPAITELLQRIGSVVSLERDDDWLERLAVHGVDGAAGAAPSAGARSGARGWLGSLARIPVSTPSGSAADTVRRIRLIGGDGPRTAEWLGGLTEVSLWAEPVTMAGPVELLAFVRDQAISVNAHRHGLHAPLRGVGGWIDEIDDRVYVAPESQP